MQVSVSEYFKPPAIAKRFQVKQQVVGKWIRSGELAAVDVSESRGRRPRWRVSQEALDAFLASRGNRPPAKVTRRRRKSPGVTEFFR